MDAIVSPSIIQSSPEPGFAEALTETKCHHSQEWTEHKAKSDALAYAVRAVLGDSYGRGLAQCSSMMHLERSPEGAVKARPYTSCKKRWCPVCAWRLNLKRWGLLVERMPALIEANGPVQFLMLTLTVRNCQTTELRSTVRAMMKGWRLMTRTVEFPATAWLRSLEVTFPRAREAHPHIHILLAVKPSYFSLGYIRHSGWVGRWKKAMKLDYDPVVDVRKVKPMEGVKDSQLSAALGGLAEVSKYVTAPADLAERPEAAVEGLAQLNRVRMVEGGGWMKGIFSEEDDDSQEELPEMESIATFWWRAVEKKYRRKL